MVDVSFLLPTNRDYQFSGKVLESIFAIPTDLEFEVCLYCPREVIQNRPFPNEVVWCPEPSAGSGPIAGFNHMVKESRGQYVVCLVDDHIVEPDIYNAIAMLESEDFRDRKYKVCTLSPGPNNLAYIPKKGDVWCGGIRVDYEIPWHTTMRFPVISRDTINDHFQGHIFHPGFKYHAGDLWMGYWLGENGEPGIQCEEAHIKEYLNLRNSEYEQMDCRYYHTLVANHKAGYAQYV